jgi:hypothetical protein
LVPCLAVTKKQVYVPYLFTGAIVRGIPLRYQPDYERLQDLSPGPDLAHGRSPNWEALKGEYDYLLLVDERFFDAPVPEEFTVIFKGRGFSLFKTPRRSNGG